MSWKRVPNVTEDCPTSASGRETLLIYRHSIVIRLAHWVGVACVAVLLMSGLQIFNAHPALYLGQASSFEHPVVSIGTAEKNGQQIGLTNVLGQRFNTTGFLGLSGKDNRDRHAPSPRGRPFPAIKIWRAGGAGTFSSPGFWSSTDRFT